MRPAARHNVGDGRADFPTAPIGTGVINVMTSNDRHCTRCHWHDTFLASLVFYHIALLCVQYPKMEVPQDEQLVPVMTQNNRFLQQDGITTDNNCFISGDFNVCPANADFTFDGVVKTLNAQIKCPFDSVAQSDFRQASQEGLCECEASLVDKSVTDASPEPLNCGCFICPEQTGQFGVAYTCDKAISGPCTTFNCAGTCNGDLEFIDKFTRAPTAAPMDGDGSAAASNSPVLVTAALVLALVRMFH